MRCPGEQIPQPGYAARHNTNSQNRECRLFPPANSWRHTSGICLTDIDINVYITGVNEIQVRPIGFIQRVPENKHYTLKTYQQYTIWIFELNNDFS